MPPKCAVKSRDPCTSKFFALSEYINNETKIWLKVEKKLVLREIGLKFCSNHGFMNYFHILHTLISEWPHVCCGISENIWPIWKIYIPLERWDSMLYFELWDMIKNVNPVFFGPVFTMHWNEKYFDLLESTDYKNIFF